MVHRHPVTFRDKAAILPSGAWKRLWRAASTSMTTTYVPTSYGEAKTEVIGPCNNGMVWTEISNTNVEPFVVYNQLPYDKSDCPQEYGVNIEFCPCHSSRYVYHKKELLDRYRIFAGGMSNGMLYSETIESRENQNRWGNVGVGTSIIDDGAIGKRRMGYGRSRGERSAVENTSWRCKGLIESST